MKHVSPHPTSRQALWLVWAFAIVAAIFAAPAAANDAPTSTGIPDFSFTDPSTVLTINLVDYFDDAETSDTLLEYSIQSVANPELLQVFRIDPGPVLRIEFLPTSRGTSTISILARDPGALIAVDDFTVTMTTPNFAPTQILLSRTSLEENGDPGVAFSTVSVVDPNAGDQITLALTDDAGGTFALAGNELMATRTLNHELDPPLIPITLTATDAAGESISTTVNIALLNVNDQPVDILLSQAFIEEDAQPEVVVGTFTTLDEDGETTFTYTLLQDESATGFKIVGDQLVVNTNTAWVYEQDREVDILVRSTDLGSPRRSVTKFFTIQLINALDRPILIRNQPTICTRFGKTWFNQSRLDLISREAGPTELLFLIVQPPTQGDLYLEGGTGLPLGPGQGIFASQIIQGRLRYEHRTISPLPIDSLVFAVVGTVGNGVIYGPLVHTIQITFANTPPLITNENRLQVAQGETAAIRPANITISDAEQALWHVALIVETLPSKGTLELGNRPLALNSAVTMEDVHLGRVLYRHDGLTNGTDEFLYRYTDTMTTWSAPLALGIDIAPLADTPPTLNAALPYLSSVLVADKVVIGSDTTEVLDAEQGPDRVLYRITRLPQYGVLNLFTNTRSVLTVGSTFTQFDVNNGRVTYAHRGGKPLDDSFEFEFTDQIGPWNGPHVYSIKVNPEPLVPTSAEEALEAYQ